MNAISLYVSASRLLFQSETENPNYSDLYRLVPYLRQSLSCTVCANLLVEPYSPQDVCQHHVCRTCIGGRKNLKPTCSSCRNYQNYQANTQLRILLQCYKSLCKYILATPLVYSSMHKHVHVDGFFNGNNEAHNLAELIDEGARFHDEYKSNSGLPKSAFSILPCIFTATPHSSGHLNQNNSSGSNVAITVNSINKSSTLTTSTSSLLSASTSSVASVVHNPTSLSHSSSSLSTPNFTLSAVSSTNDTNDSITVVGTPAMMQNPPIKTVSNGTALYSVLYAGTGNKITIKRKTDDSVFSRPSTMSAKEMLSILSGNSAGIQQKQQLQPQEQSSLQKTHQIVQQHQHQQSVQIIQQSQLSQNFKKPTVAKTVKPIQKRKGCRCGNATPTPGKLTCCGQRCPCYVESKSCVDCKCRGCRNPHRIDGFKVRPQIPELTCFVQMNNRSIENNYVDMPMETFSTAGMTTTTSTSILKQEFTSNLNTITTNHHRVLAVPVNQQMDLHSANDTIEYIPNELDDGNIQVVNVYTTHMPEISSTLPTIIMQDESSSNINNSTNLMTTAPALTLHSRLSMPSETTYSLIGEDIIKHSFSDDGCSSDDPSDVEIDI